MRIAGRADCPVDRERSGILSRLREQVNLSIFVYSRAQLVAEITASTR
jgi:hypothetical protein